MFSKYGNCMRLLKIKNKLKVGCFLQIKSERILDVSRAFLIKQLALALVGYEMIIANCASLAIYHLLSNAHSHLSLLLNSRVNDSV